MKCVACKEPLLAIEWDQIELDHCLGCKGTWLDSGELELLLGGTAPLQAWLQSFSAEQSVREKARRCPICQRKMEKVLYPKGSKRVVLDRCYQGHGIWCDGGELEAILDLEDSLQARDAASFLRKVFKGKT